MDNLGLYVVGCVIVVIVFVAIVRQVLKELDNHGDFLESKEEPVYKATPQELIAHFEEQSKKYLNLCNELEQIFIEFCEQLSENKERARALISVLNSLKELASDELKDKLAKLLPEFEELIKKELGEEKADEFFEKCQKSYEKCITTLG